MFNYFFHRFKYGKYIVSIENGFIARKTTSSVLINMNNTIILVNVVCKKNKSFQNDFFPLNIQYQERSYSAGKIPGNFFRREGRPSENEILISRLIDRSVRPLFPTNFLHEIQVIATLISLNPEVNPDIVAIIGVSTALSISGIHFKGPVASSRVGIINNSFVLNPNISDMKKTNLDLIVSSVKDEILMIEAKANILNEKKMLEAIDFGCKTHYELINNINIFMNKTNKYNSISYNCVKKDIKLLNNIRKLFEKRVIQVYLFRNRENIYEKIKIIKEEISEILLKKFNKYSETKINFVIKKVEKELLKYLIFNSRSRIDNRKNDSIRPLHMGVNFTPNTHGSSFFTRGKTQAIVFITLGTSRDAQNRDELYGKKGSNSFLFHYNFPPYAVGEIGILGVPKRREIGHGNLARKSFLYLMPSLEIFPYTVRVVSEITESDGSSSMASVCGASLALMDAGVPIKKAVAGVAMGLIKIKNKYVILTDISGYEDNIGDMDFKSAGTMNGITSLQMDIKNKGINLKILKIILEKAKKARIKILNFMNKIIKKHRKKISKNAPHIYKFEINPKKIKDIIGKGGSVIKKITETTDTQIDIENNGIIRISSSNSKKAKKAIVFIKKIVSDIKINNIYCGTVTKIVNFGAFVLINDKQKEGLVHISHIINKRINKVKDYLKIGQKIYVKVLDIDRQGKIRLSIKEAKEENLLNKIILPD
ncbi:polyribonucleotide nucleotidyltransferase [Candidatus Annandia pinicola]|uniref:polyribonucleotide nucleotidyltransferase n=1 Tax=Candidatus Annandia pinicola TaxID=1345117 RepID=UPI001D00AD36|nr:polyribonucleotide nucleotidyltransferase [Candidatus Annandia pinicola]UDG80291.1 Polyribonucleotide nucleotidyltransferase [Candidatus Annandia pinicola]